MTSGYPKGNSQVTIQGSNSVLLFFFFFFPAKSNLEGKGQSDILTSVLTRHHRKKSRTADFREYSHFYQFSQDSECRESGMS